MQFVVAGGGGGAPTTAQYWVGAADGTLSAEHNLGALGTGLVINTAGTPSIYAGSTCGANQYATQASASGALTCSQPAFANISGTVSDAQLASNYSGVGTCTNQFARVLNDNAAPTCASVSLTADVTGTLAQTNGGTGAGSLTCAAGDFITSNGTAYSCATPPGGGGGLSYAQVAAAVMGGF